MKKTAFARQSETKLSTGQNKDFRFNLKYKNNELTILISAYAVRICDV